MITLSWIIERLLVRKVEGTYSDVVITADWRCNGTQDQYSGTCYGSASFAPPSGSFTPYEDLTQEQVLGWCYANGVDQKAIEANVTIQIENQINPPIIAPPLPWVPPVDNSVISAPKPLRDEQIVDPFLLPTSDVPPSVDGMSTTILG
jgi:hypothetical protein